MKSFAVLALAVILAPAALAQHQTFAVNPDASEVKMTLKTTHELVNGAFHIQSGSVEFDRSTPKMSGSVVVLAGSGKTGNGSRDKKMICDAAQQAIAVRDWERIKVCYLELEIIGAADASRQHLSPAPQLLQ